MASTLFSPESVVATLDLRGLKCPMPVLRTRKALRRLARGDRILVLSTDPLAAIDIPHLLQEQGDVLEQQEAVGDILRFVVRKG